MLLTGGAGGGDLPADCRLADDIEHRFLDRIAFRERGWPELGRQGVDAAFGEAGAPQQIGGAVDLGLVHDSPSLTARILPRSMGSGGSTKNRGSGDMTAASSEFPRFDLSGQVVLVTAAARGLGRACALACAHAGADIALGLRDKKSGEGLVAGDPEDGPQGTAAADGHDQHGGDRERRRRGRPAFRQDRRAGEQCRGEPGEPGRETSTRRIST